LSSDNERDKEILDVVIRAYEFQSSMRQRLDTKLNSFIAIISTIAALNSGIAFFVLDNISPQNPFHLSLIFIFLGGTAYFIFGLVKGLMGYKPTYITIYPENPERLIEDYQEKSKEEVIQTVAASLAEVTNANYLFNAEKSRTINWVFYFLICGILIMFEFAVYMALALRI
jgi:hypothetical protein